MSEGGILVKPVATRRGLNSFVKLPWRIYKNDPCWVPPLLHDQKNSLNREKNPFFKHGQTEYFLAWCEGKPVGRIAAIINHAHNEYHGEKAGFFGFFECVEDYAVAEALFDAALKWLKGKGAQVVYGPESFSTNDECGFLVEGYDRPPVIMMPYSKKYYISFAEKYGFEKAKDLYAYYLDTDIVEAERVLRLADKLKQRDRFMVRHLDMRRFEQEIDVICDVYNSAWNNNWGFVPMTKVEIKHLAKELKPVVEPRLVLFAEVNGEPAGFAVALPDYNQVLARLDGRLFPLGFVKLLWYKRKIDGLRIIALGVVEKYQKRGIETVFIAEIIKAMLDKGYNKGELSWILEDNELMKRPLEQMGAKRYKTYRIYQKPL